MFHTVRPMRGECWEIDGDYDPIALFNALRAFTARGWELHLEAVNLGEEVVARYEQLNVKPKLYVSPCLDVIDRTATHHRFDFPLGSPVLDVLADLASKLYVAEYADSFLIHDGHVLVDGCSFPDGSLLVSSKVTEAEVRSISNALGKALRQTVAAPSRRTIVAKD